MENFLYKYLQQKLKQYQISNLKNSITPNELEVVIKNLPTKITWNQMDQYRLPTDLPKEDYYH